MSKIWGILSILMGASLFPFTYWAGLEITKSWSPGVAQGLTVGYLIGMALVVMGVLDYNDDASESKIPTKDHLSGEGHS